MRPASSVSSISDVDPSECLCLEYQMRGDVPGMEIDMTDDSFWVPIACRTRSRQKSSSVT